MTDIRRTLLWGDLPRLAVLHLGIVEPAQRPALDVRAAAARVAAPASPATTPAPVPTPLPGTGLPGAATPPAAVPAAIAGRRRRAGVGASRRRAGDGLDRPRARRPSTAPAPTLVRVELLTQVDPIDHSKHVVLLDRSPSRLYLAESGLWPAATGPGALPEHHTLMTLVSSERTLKGGANELTLALRVARSRRREAGQDLHLPPRQLRRRRGPRSSTTPARPSSPTCTCSWCATARCPRAAT